MTHKQKEILEALAWMCEQYLSRGNGLLDHEAMHADELAIEVPASCGFVESDIQGDRWTEKGLLLLEGS
ncbi:MULTISPECIES: hypothetical protein [Rhizobium]|uniref:hypothetical protein n=1 Tax=Rhizobium TaxID=379 RepID=UPI0002F651CA|nr:MULTISPECIES: hypothetical protein [Rhizobium]ARQ58973.1 hypothetical protein Kim5_CH02931 [Rhizobium sp. Kim5]UWU33033.1 hypothetical protein N2597_12730 [Rhizobium leguminosarum bv. phaseoli]